MEETVGSLLKSNNFLEVSRFKYFGIKRFAVFAFISIEVHIAILYVISYQFTKSSQRAQKIVDHSSRPLNQCARAVCYPLYSCWFGQPGWPGERDFVAKFEPGLGSRLTRLARLSCNHGVNFFAFNKRTETSANRGSPANRTRPAHVISVLYLPW